MPDKRRINPSALRLFIRRSAPHFKGGGILTQERKDQLLKEALKLIGTHLDEDENTVRALQQHLGMTVEEIAECGLQVGPTLTDVRREFVMKLMECWNKRQGEWEKLTPSRLIDCAEEIAVAQHLVNELPNILEQGEMEFLLRFRDPLEVASGTWIGNGWTVDVVAHILSYCPRLGAEDIEVLSMYDGMSCGQIALGKLGAHISKYYQQYEN